MISKCDDCEYTITIADLMTTLSKLDQFTLHIWISSYENSFKYSEVDDIQFLQECLRIVCDGHVDYIFYDLITMVRIYYDNYNKELVTGFE